MNRIIPTVLAASLVFQLALQAQESPEAVSLPTLGIPPSEPPPTFSTTPGNPPPPGTNPIPSADGPTGWWIEVEGAAAAEVWAAAENRADRRTAIDDTAAHMAETAQTRASVLQALSSRSANDTTVLYETSRVLNGIAVLTTAAEAKAIEAIDGVVRVTPLPLHYPMLDTSVPFLGVPEMWTSHGGLTGQNIRMGIIDSGVDYLHPTFDGPGEGYDDNDTTVIGDVPGFPGTRVVGGIDLVGDAYNADHPDPANRIGIPDPDPMDCSSHGTHVASIAAGMGVTAEGETYHGPFDGSAPFDTMILAPGVAPQVDIYAIRVFGCNGSTLYVVQAMEWASDPNGDGDFSDRLDVANFSLGGDFGRGDSIDSLAADNLAMLGCVVVAAAGNSGDAAYVMGTPGASKRAITVASTHDGGGEDPADTASSFSSRGPEISRHRLKPDVAAPGSLINGAVVGTTNFLVFEFSGTSMATPHVAGLMAILRQHRPTWTVEELKAAIMSTADIWVTTGSNGTGDRHSVQRMGTGRVLPQAALETTVFVTNDEDDGSVSLSFGHVEVLGSTSITRNGVLVNKGDSPATYDLQYISTISQPGVTVTLPNDPITAPAGGSIAFPVRVDVNVLQMDKVRDPTMSATHFAGGFTWPRDFPFEESGVIRLLPQSPSPQNPPLRLAMHISPRAASNMDLATANFPVLQDDGSNNVHFAGTALNMGSNYPSQYPLDVVPLIYPLELIYAKEKDSDLPNNRKPLDLQYVGLHMVPSEIYGNTLLRFGVVTHANWATPNEIQVLIDFDHNGDGVPNATLANGSVARYYQRQFLNAPSATDVHISGTILPELSADFFYDGFSPTLYDTNQYATRAMILPVRASRLGLPSYNPNLQFRVSILGYSVGSIEPVTVTSWMPLDLETPGLESPFATYLITGPGFYSLSYNRQGLLDRDVSHLLFIHKHNTSESMAQLLPIDYGATSYWMIH